MLLKQDNLDKSETRHETSDKNNIICSHFNMIKQEAALARVHSNLSQSMLMLEN